MITACTVSIRDMKLCYFSGGLLSRGITEIAGESASGKTQLCMQLCLTVQLPLQLGGFSAGNFSNDPLLPLKGMCSDFHWIIY